MDDYLFLILKQETWLIYIDMREEQQSTQLKYFISVLCIFIFRIIQSKQFGLG